MAHEVGNVATATAPAGAPGGAERRREARFECRKPVELLPCAGGDGSDQRESAWSFLRADLTDCSVHGIGLIVGRPLQGGERFLLKVRIGTFPCVVLYTVRNCRPGGGKGLYRIGAEFSGYLVAPRDTDRQNIVDALMK